MKVLLTADLHCNQGWFRWLEEEAGKYELICIAGDLLNIFSKVAIGDQLVHVRSFLQRLAKKTSVAACSGNHDEIEILAPLVPGTEACYAASWLEELSELPRLIGDERTQLIGSDLIVTTIPFSCSIGLERKLIEEGERLKAEHVLPWLLMSHDPARAEAMISRAKPDFVHFGHCHEPDGFSRRSGNTLFLRAGQRLEAAIPNHIVLDSDTGIAVWKCNEGGANGEPRDARTDD